MEKSQLFYVCRNKFCTYYMDKTPFQIDIDMEGVEIKKCPKCGESKISVMEPQPTSGAGFIKKKLNYKLYGIIAVVVIIITGTLIFQFTGHDGTKKIDKPAQLTKPVIQPLPVVKEPVKSNKAATTVPPGEQSKAFSDGSKYVGEMKNGLMHGLGTYYYGSEQIISNKDLKKRKALAGDYLIGEWYEGNVVNGKLFDKNNNQKEVIIIGR